MPPLPTIGALALIYALALTLLLKLALARHGRKEPSRAAAIPRLGGLAVLAAATAALATLALLRLHSVWPALSRDASLRALGVPLLMVMLVGVADDLAGLSPLWKLGGQMVAALMVVGAGVHIRMLLHHPLPPWLAIPATVVWLVGCSNAFNLIDGLDGLACGLALFATGTVLAHAVLTGQPGLALLTTALLGALGGFLVFNFHPASIFLGDTGSLAIGFLLGALALLWADKATTLLGLMAPLFALLVPIADTGLAIVRRRVRGHAIFAGDRDHVHHRLLRRGLRPRDAVLVLYLVGGLGAAAALLVADLQRHMNAELVILLFAILLAVGIEQLGYTELNEPGRRWRRAARRRAAADAVLRQLAAAAGEASGWTALEAALAQAGAALGFARAELCGERPAAPAVWTIEMPLRAGPQPIAVRLYGPCADERDLPLEELAAELRVALTPALERLLVPAAGAGRR